MKLRCNISTPGLQKKCTLKLKVKVALWFLNIFKSEKSLFFFAAINSQ